MPARQFRYWILTIPFDDWSVPEVLPPDITYMIGQKEIGTNAGYQHWQLCIHIKKCTLAAIKRVFPTAHAEPTRSSAAENYCGKESTAVEGSQFVLGEKPMNRSSKTDWSRVRLAAESGDLRQVPDDVFVRCYSNLKKIKLDYEKPTSRGPVKIRLFLGPSGTGKSYTAWKEFGESGGGNAHDTVYVKTPTTKWWDGYQGETQVIIDEFRGQVSIGLLLRWLDPAGYPLTLETKGGGCVAKFTDIILTSNIHPQEWYPDLDIPTRQALLRRIEIVEFNTIYQA